MIGVRTLTFWSESPGAVDRKGIAEPVYAGAEVAGCQIQPRRPNEKVTNIDYAIEEFEVFAPPTAAAMACKVDDYIQDGALGSTTSTATLTAVADNGALYRVIGAKAWYAANGAPHHVTVVAEVPSGIP